jgi:uncharacterized protein with ACT and thioredoxin-like domain
VSNSVRIGAHRVFEDRIDFVVREAGAGETVRVSLRLSRAAALALAGQLIAAGRDEGDTVPDVPAILEHPAPLDAAADPRAPP